MKPFAIDPKSPLPVWAQTKRRLAYLISSGYYQEGEKLPTVRDLASELGINYNTVNKAYQDLERDGYVYTIRGKGAYVTSNHPDELDDIQEDLSILMQDFIERTVALGMTGEEILGLFITCLAKAELIDPKTTASTVTRTKEMKHA